jgi:hypothetical protein
MKMLEPTGAQRLNGLSNTIDRISDNLRDIVGACDRLGFKDLGSELTVYVMALSETAMLVRKAHSEIIDAVVKETEQSTINMIAAALNGVKMGSDQQ